MTIYASKEDKRQARLYWGAGPLPADGTLIGRITRTNGETGAAIKMPDGTIVQGNAGAIRTTVVKAREVTREEREAAKAMFCKEDSPFHKKNFRVILREEDAPWVHLRDLIYHYKDGDLTVTAELKQKMQRIEEFLIENDHEFFW